MASTLLATCTDKPKSSATPTSTDGPTSSARPALPPGCVRTNPGQLADPGTGGRDPSRWPFSSQSPWNTPIGTGATYADASDLRVKSVINPAPAVWINAGTYSQPIYFASHSDPIVTVHERHCPDARFHMPANAVPASGSDANLNVIDPTLSFVDECWATSGAAPDLTCGRHVRTDLRGAGFGEGGTRASRASTIGGLIRQWEVDAGAIRHALALALPGGDLAVGPIWPATEDDFDAADTYFGSAHMGTLVALPPDVDLTALDLGPFGVMLGHALQDFGAYVVDRGGSTSLYAEPSLEDTPQIEGMRAAWFRLRPLLRVITDNGPDHPGGPGTRRVSPAPSLG